MTNITDRLQEKRIVFSNLSQWEASYSSLYDKIKSYKDFKKYILTNDVNTKIFVIRDIAPLIFDLLSDNEKKELLSILKSHLSNNRMCEIGYSYSYADEEDTITVSDAAKYTISKIREINK